MQKIDFIKMHGLGNDFVIIDKRSKDISITENLIRQLSDRRTCLLYTSDAADEG